MRLFARTAEPGSFQSGWRISTHGMGTEPMYPDKATERLLEEILVDAYGEDEQLWAFRQAFEDEVPLPAEGSIIGETVLVNKIDYDGNTQICE